LKIVLDINVLISALIKEGKPRQLLFAIVRSNHKLITSEPILEELALVAGEPRVQKYASPQEIADFMRDIATASKIVEVRSKFKVVEQDPSDDVVLRTAFDARAGHIVSGDRHLLELRRYRGIRIVSAGEMLRIL
jgi:putative PIN family toxin of toxin-antitoxin system